jgi:stage II sporulation protein AA (anti-sigma F factor antagonist)
VEIKAHGEVLTVYLQGEIDHHSAKGMREEIDRAVNFNMPSLLILDFSEVTFMDSSGIGLVMGRYRQIRYNDGQLQIINTSPQIYKVMRIAGLQRLAVIEQGDKRRESLL